MYVSCMYVIEGNSLDLVQVRLLRLRRHMFYYKRDDIYVSVTEVILLRNAMVV